MFEILASKQVDIYIALATSLIGAVFGVVLDRTMKSGAGVVTAHGETPAVGVSMQQVVQVSWASKNNVNDQLIFFLVGAFLFIVGTVYLFFREEVLVAGLLLVLFIFGAWAGSVVNSLYRGFFCGWRWVAYLLVMLLFALAAVRVVGLAKTPMYTPPNFVHAQDIVNQWGIMSLPQYFSPLDFRWFAFHLIGVILFFAASWRACLSMLNYAVVGTRLNIGLNEENIGGRIASAYGRPWRNSLFLLGFMIAANYLVSGQFFMWFEYQMPNQIDYIIHVVLYGRQAL